MTPRRSVLCHLHFGVEPPDEALGGLCTLGDLRIEGPRGLCGDDLLERFALRYQHRHSVAHCKHHVALRYSPRHRWYYYPRMGTDEVLAFKLFECRKDDPEPTRFRSVLHTAFADPDTPAGAEERQSEGAAAAEIIERAAQG